MTEELPSGSLKVTCAEASGSNRGRELARDRDESTHTRGNPVQQKEVCPAPHLVGSGHHLQAAPGADLQPLETDTDNASAQAGMRAGARQCALPPTGSTQPGRDWSALQFRSTRAEGGGCKVGRGWHEWEITLHQTSAGATPTRQSGAAKCLQKLAGPYARPNTTSCPDGQTFWLLACSTSPQQPDERHQQLACLALAPKARVGRRAPTVGPHTTAACILTN